MIINSIDDYLKYKNIDTYTDQRTNVSYPCLNTFLVNRNLIRANDYNPNNVSSEKMELLRQSIVDNGFCFPIVTIFDNDDGVFVIIDGFHRYTISGEKWLNLKYVPITVLAHDISKRMVATVQFNKARGTHQVDLDADVIRKLIEQGMSEDDICQHLQIDHETVHRYKQLTGVAEIFKNSNYSMAWKIQD